MKKTDLLPIFVLAISTSVPAFWGGNNNWTPFSTNSWSPFGSGTGYNNQAPWGGSSNWNPMATGGNWSPRNDAANMSRYGAHPYSLVQYRNNPMFQYEPLAPAVQNRVQPSDWLTETDFAATLEEIENNESKTFIIDDFAAFGLTDGYVRAKSETLGLGRGIRDHLGQHTDNLFGTTDTIYGKQGYALSPAASSTVKIQN